MNGVPSVRRRGMTRSRPSTARRHRGLSRGLHHVFRSLLSTAAVVTFLGCFALVIVASAAEEPEFIASSSGSAPSSATADTDDAATRDTTPAEVDVDVNVIEGEEEELEEGGTSDVGWSPPPEHLIDVASGTTDGEVYAGIGASLSLDALRVLEDYPRERREEILDLLFKPGYGAAVQVVKVEIGLGNETDADGGGEDGEEEELSVLLSEALTRNPDLSVYATLPPLEEEEPAASELVNLVVARLERAKSKGDIVFDYLGLPPPRDDHDASMFNPFFAKTLRAFLDTYGFTGTKLVARTAPGVNGGDVEGLCDALEKEEEYAAAIYAVSTSALPTGRGDPEEESKIFAGCKASNTKIWYASSDEYGQGGYGDRNGAARWLLTTLSTMVESNAVASVSLDALFASVHGASSQSYGSSILTANQPSTVWHNGLVADGDGAPLLWAMAHLSQFTGPGWRMLPYGWGTGIFSRTGGLGYYVGFVSPDEKDFTLVAVKLRGDRTCGSKSEGGGGDIGGGGGGDNKNEAIQFKFRYGLKYLPDESSKPLQMYYSNFEAEEMSPGGKNARRRPPRLFGHRGQAHMDENGSFLLGFGPGDVYTVSTVRNANKARIRSAYSPASDPTFELPYGDDFEGYEEGRRKPRYFSDQVGVWEVRPEYKAKGNDEEEVCEEKEEGTCAADPSTPKNTVLRPMATGHTVIGMSELNDVTVSAKYRIAPSSSSPMDFAAYAAAASSVSACVGVRADRLWKNGLALCVAGGARGVVWTLSYGGPPPEGRHTKLDKVVATGRLPSGGGGGWHELSLTVRGTEVNATLDGTDLFQNRKKVEVRDNGSGFAVLGTNFGPQGYGGERAVIVEFDDFQMDLAPGAAPAADAYADTSASSKWDGRALGAAPCSRNGVPDPRQSFDLLADGRIRLVSDEAAAADGSVIVDLCAHLQGKYGPPASGRSAGLSLAPCRRGAFEQHFKTHGGDWCRVRDAGVAVPLSLGGYHGTEAQHRTLLHKRVLALTGYGNGTVAIVNEREGGGAAEEEEAKEEGGELKWKEWAYFPNTKQLRNQAFGAETGLGYPMCLTVMVP